MAKTKQELLQHLDELIKFDVGERILNGRDMSINTIREICIINDSSAMGDYKIIYETNNESSYGLDQRMIFPIDESAERILNEFEELKKRLVKKTIVRNKPV